MMIDKGFDDYLRKKSGERGSFDVWALESTFRDMEKEQQRENEERDNRLWFRFVDTEGDRSGHDRNGVLQRLLPHPFFERGREDNNDDDEEEGFVSLSPARKSGEDTKAPFRSSFYCAVPLYDGMKESNVYE